MKKERPYPTIHDEADFLELPNGELRNLDGSEIEFEIEHFAGGKVLVTINGIPMCSTEDDLRAELRAAVDRMTRENPKFAADMAIIRAMARQRKR